MPDLNFSSNCEQWFTGTDLRPKYGHRFKLQWENIHIILCKSDLSHSVHLPFKLFVNKQLFYEGNMIVPF